MNGFLLIDKPAGITSHDVVDKIRKLTKQRQVGHAGTLDPSATGLLVVGINQACKFMQFIEGLDKEYTIKIMFGVSTDTLDMSGNVTGKSICDHVTQELLESVLSGYLGKIEQEVPAYSAIRMQGRKLYQLAREGKQVVLPKRIVEINQIKLLQYIRPVAEVNIHCSKGTYVRSLARDIGAKMNTLAVCSAIRRIRIGHLHVNDSVGLAQISAPAKTEDVLNFLPTVELEKENERLFLNGMPVSVKPAGETMRIIGPSGFLGIGAGVEGSILPKKVFKRD